MDTKHGSCFKPVMIRIPLPAMVRPPFGSPISPLHRTYRISCIQNDHTVRRGTICANLTADLRQKLTETHVELGAMYEKHHEDVTAVSLLGTCLDIDGMDSFYEEACCGREG